ncbi:hypothetical protein KY290_021716 [Solanum tuberosum]|uniref:Uncharacterized protein n=1 Tax=Solanum tuberosum TaxID=4113 RepID=A0ABQ7V2C2_SOLTU|nr:hypothetical protein KY290_021716 [Solanum tuberosum]
MFDQTPKSFDVDSEEEAEEQTALVWSRKGVRGANASTMVVPDLGGVDVVLETELDKEHVESEWERKRKGKGKMVESHTKGDKKRYTTRGEMQKLMGSAIVANEIQMEKNKKRRRDSYVPEEPTSTPLPIGIVVKRRKEAEIEWVKSKRGNKSLKKSPMKNKSMSRKATVKSKPVKGPGPCIQKPVEEKVMTREERITEMEN